MSDRSVVTKFEAKVDGYLRGVTQMSGATEKFAKTASTSAAKHTADWNKVSKAAVVGGAAIGAVVLAAAKSYADFEKAMSGVAAVADANAGQLKALGVAARDAGKATVFSATEAANAEAELAKAGVSVSDIMGGALTGSLSLAAAGQIGLADAATISAQAMNIFNKEGSDVGHIADVLTAGANKSAAGVDDLGLALQQGGLVAKQTGLSLEDTVGTLAAFADNALKGSDAGTSMKTMFQRLNPQSDEAAALMDQLNLRAYDAQGNFVGVAKYAGKLQTALADMSSEQRNAALQTLFGSDAVRGANVLYEQGEAGIRQYISAVDDQGAAQRMAARQTDNLVGDIEKLKGALTDAFIGAGEGGNDGIRSLVQDLTSLIDKWGELDPAMQANIVKGAAVVAGLLLVGGGVIKATTTLLSFKKSLDAAGVSTPALSAKAGAAAPILARVALSLAAVANADALFGNSKAALSISQLTKELEGTDDVLRTVNQAFADNAEFADRADSGIRSIGDAFRTSFDPSAMQKVDKTLGSIKGIFSGTDYSDIATATERLSQLDQTLAKMASSGHADEAKAAFADISREAARQGVSVKDVQAKFPGYIEALDNATVAAKDTAAAGIQLSNSEMGAAKTAEQAALATKAWADSIDALNSPVLDAREAARQLEAAIDGVDASIKDNGKTLDIHTEKGRANQASLDGVAKAALDQIGALQANGSSQKTMQKTLDTSRDKLIKAAEKFGMSKSAAKAYADQVLTTPTAVTTTVTLKKAGVDLPALQRQINNLRGNDVRINVRYVESGASPGGGVNKQGGIVKDDRAAGGAISGPGTGTSDSIDARLSNGEHVLTAAEVQKAGGQDAIYRMRAGIRAGALRFRDGGAVGPAKFAGGGEVDFSAIMALVGDITDWDSVLKARSSSTSKASAITAAKNALASLVNQQKKAARDLASARRSGDRDRISDILDRQRLLLGKVAAAEGKLAAARTASAVAAKNSAAVEKEYRNDHSALIDRTDRAARSSNTVTATFLRNISTLQSRGYGALALQLMEMGGPDAEQLAADAVRWPSAAANLAKSFAESASLSAKFEAMKAAASGALPGFTTSGGYDYSQVRDLSGVMRTAPNRAAVTVFAPQVTVQAGVGDPVAIGAVVEKVLVEYQNDKGSDLEFQRRTWRPS